MEKKGYCLGFDVGGTKIGIGLIDKSGVLVDSDRVENMDTYPDEILPQLASVALKLIERNNLTIDEVRAFGISTPGIADIPNGIMTRPTNNKHWRDVPIQKYLEDALNIKGYFENDANAAALAEGYFGAGKGCDDYIYLTMSTGIGAGIVTNGTLVQGTKYYGGEAGHTILVRDGRKCNCGLTGCYEAYCGGRAIADDLRVKLADQPDSQIRKCAGSLENIDMRSLQEAVELGDEFAIQYWDEMIEHNAHAIGNLITIFNPKKIILGTFAWAAGDLFFAPLKEKLKKYCWKESYDACDIVASELRRDIGYYAGAAVVLYWEQHQK